MPPDNVVCAGNNQVVLMVNGVVRFYSTSGAVLKTITLSSLFGSTSGSFTDPRCQYDAVSSRWVLIIDYFKTDSNGNLLSSGLYIIATKTADATGAYWKYFFELKSFCSNGQCFMDYPTLGIDKYAVW